MSYMKQHELGLAGLALLRNRLVGDKKTTREVLEEIHRLAETPKNALLSSLKVKEYSVKAGYQAWSDTYDNIPNLLIKVEESVVKSLLRKFSPGRALDVACGTGRYSKFLHTLGHEVTGVDFSSAMLRHAKTHNRKIKFIKGDLRKLPFDDNNFDLAICALVLTHFSNIDQILIELSRVVRSDGYIVISDIHPWLVALGGQAEFHNKAGKRGYIRNYVHWHERIVFPVPGWPNNMCLVSEHLKLLGNVRSLWMPDNDAWYLPDLVFGALFSLRKSIYTSVGGYDERFYGWGCTDGFLAAKAIASGQYIVPIYAASGLHISHPPRSGEKQQLEYKKNRDRFFRFLRTYNVSEHSNWLSHAKDRIIESFTSQSIRKPSGSSQKNSNQQRKENKLKKIDSLLAIGEFARAITMLKNYPGKDKDRTWILRLGRAFLGVGRYREAIKTLKEIPVSAELAIAQAANSQFTVARTTLKRFSQAYPQAPDLSYWYYCSTQKHIKQGIAYFNQKFYHVALRCFEAALIIESNNITALKYRYQCLQMLKLKGEI